MVFLKVLLVLLVGLATLQPCLGQSRVVGGTPVLNNRYPYFAELRIVFMENGQQYVTYCGGALITSEIVLVRGRMKCKMRCRIFRHWLMICLCLPSL
jgi:secreted trypsin-like serine protease